VDDSMTDNSATCGCGAGEAASPWDMQSAVVNQVLMSAPALIGAVALARYRRRKLLIFLPAAIAFLTVWRRYTCARCRYYGQACSTLLGVATARMMPRDTTKELDRQTMQLDFAFLGAVMLIPLRQVLKSRVLAVAYFLTSGACVAAILRNACPRCGNEFCPMKDLSRLVAGGGD
jgi:hypothetical protein